MVAMVRASAASEPRERSAPAKRRARERVGESEGRSPSDNTRVQLPGLETDLPVVADDAESTPGPLIGQPAPFGAECQIETLRQVAEGPRCLAEVLILLLEMRPLFFEALDDGLTLHEVGRSLRPQNSSHGAQRPNRTRPPPLSGYTCIERVTVTDMRPTSTWFPEMPRPLQHGAERPGDEREMPVHTKASAVRVAI